MATKANSTQNNKQNDEKKSRRIVIMIIILIIIILCLITSCSCSSKFWGRIGDILKREENVNIDDNTGDRKENVNTDLKFDVDNLEISLSDERIKLGYHYTNINPKELTCTTSDSSIATCYVSDGYVVINPKAIGKVTVTLQTETNGQIYKATADVRITEASRYITLSSTEGTIDLKYGNTKVVSYTLDGIVGKVTVSSSDETVATATAENGVLTITGLKPGTAKITISVTYNNTTYTTTFTVKVTNTSSSSTGSKPGNTTKPGSSNNNKPGTDPDDNNIGDVSDPDIPSKPLDSDSSLSNITSSTGTINFSQYTYIYRFGVDYSVDKITLNATPSSSKSKVIYTLNENRVSSLEDLELKVGDNIVMITVVAEDGTVSIYKIIINRASSNDNALSNLTVSDGTMEPVFDKNTLDYQVDVEANIDKISVYPTLSDENATMQFIFNGKVVTSLDDLDLLIGKNTVKIIVSADDGSERTYTVDIYRGTVAENNYLSSLEINGFDLDKKFNKFKNNYNVDVNYNTDQISLSAIPENKNSDVKYTINGKEIDPDDINSIPLKEGENTLEITVISENGNENTYTVNIFRPTRTIEFNQESEKVNIEDTPYNLTYTVYETDRLGNKNEVSNYDIKDIDLKVDSFQGEYELNKGYITINPTNDMIDKTSKFEITYNDRTSSTEITFAIKDYYLSINPYPNNYDIVLIDELPNTGEFFLNTNLFVGNIKVGNIPNLPAGQTGVRLTSSTNPNIYVDVYTDDIDLIKSLTLEDTSATNTLAVTANAIKEGTAVIKVIGHAYNKTYELDDITLNIINKYTVILDANGGLFNENTPIYEYLRKSGEKLNVDDHIPRKESDQECYYYIFERFNNKEDGTGSINYYPGDEIVVEGTTELYAIYKDETEYIATGEQVTLYLAEEDIFENKEYYDKYKVKKMIYPGAQGSYVMTFENSSSNDVIIKAITLDEHPVCDNKGNCLNMGYIVRHNTKVGANKYYYGNEKNGNAEIYEILNNDSNKTVPSNGHNVRRITFGDGINVPKGAKIENGDALDLTLFWKWVEIDDLEDTAIGNMAATVDGELKYKLTVSIDFERVNNNCPVKE